MGSLGGWEVGGGWGGAEGGLRGGQQLAAATRAGLEGAKASVRVERQGGEPSGKGESVVK